MDEIVTETTDTTSLSLSSVTRSQSRCHRDSRPHSRPGIVVTETTYFVHVHTTSVSQSQTLLPYVCYRCRDPKAHTYPNHPVTIGVRISSSFHRGRTDLPTPSSKERVLHVSQSTTTNGITVFDSVGDTSSGDTRYVYL